MITFMILYDSDWLRLWPEAIWFKELCLCVFWGWWCSDRCLTCCHELCCHTRLSCSFLLVSDVIKAVLTVTSLQSFLHAWGYIVARPTFKIKYTDHLNWVRSCCFEIKVYTFIDGQTKKQVVSETCSHHYSYCIQAASIGFSTSPGS